MKKILDEKGRLFGVINIVDIIVILLALVIIAGVFVKYSQNERTNSASADLQTVTYRMELNTVREGIANNLRAGDYIYDQDNDVQLGTITDVQVSDATSAESTADGTYVEGTVQDRYDVVLTIQADAQIVNGRYYVNKSDEISVNHEKKSYTKYCTFTATVIDIEK